MQKAKVYPGRSLTERRFKLIVNFNAWEIHPRNLGDDPVANAFVSMGAAAFPERRQFEFYDVQNDPFETENLAYDPRYRKERERMHRRLMQRLAQQGDFLLQDPPRLLLKPTLHPFDETSRWKTVEPHLEGRLSSDNYLEAHY